MYRTDIGRSKSRYALLGLLSVRPMSGYDIKRFIEQALSHFWKQSYGSIYPMLRQLTEENLVVRKTQRGAGAPDRHVYSLTERGAVALREWLRGETEEEAPIRSEFLLKVFFGAQTGNEALIALMERFTTLERLRLERLRAAEAAIQETRKRTAEAFYWHLTVRRGLHATEARLRWAEETLRELSTVAARRRDRHRRAAGRTR